MKHTHKLLHFFHDKRSIAVMCGLLMIIELAFPIHHEIVRLLEIMVVLKDTV